MSLKVKFNDFIKESNKHLIPRFKEFEKVKFETDIKLYKKMCEVFGSTIFENLSIYRDNKKINYWELKVV